jgi:hypothetical protein
MFGTGALTKTGRPKVGAQIAAECIREAVAEIAIPAGTRPAGAGPAGARTVRFTVRIGVTSFVPGERPIDCADQALYAAATA